MVFKKFLVEQPGNFSSSQDSGGRREPVSFSFLLPFFHEFRQEA